MDKRNSISSDSKFEQFKLSVRNTDIRILTILPALTGFGGFIIWLLVMELLTQGSTSQAAFEIALGVACLIESLAGIAQIYKQEMPGGFGRIIRGKYPVGSGIIIVIVFGFSGIYILISGFTKLFLN